jgi:hypothetical protein
VKRFDEVLVSNAVYVFGYPKSLGLPHIPQLDYARPLLRSGIVAGKNEARRAIIIDCLVYPGNSGGPVVEIAHEAPGLRLRVIGVAIEYVPAVTSWEQNGQKHYNIAHSGYSVVTSMDPVLSLIEQLKQKP